MPIKQVSLAYKDGGSDKVYHAQIEEKDGGFIVNFQYGRRGSTLSTGCKTSSAVPLEKAEKVFEKLVQEKKAKGYSEGESGAVFQSQSLEERFTGITPMLLLAIKKEESEIGEYFSDSSWLMQEKIDGRRMMIKKTGDNVVGINKKGLSILMPQVIADAMLQVPQDFIIDGEIIGEKYYLYDVMEFDNVDMRKTAVEDRVDFMETFALKHLAIPTYRTPSDKKAAFNKLKANKKEGVVFKKIGSGYVPGRPSSKGNQLKFRFFESATVHVSAVNAQRSVAVAVYDEKNVLHKMGNITIPPNFDVPEVGSIVEVRYAHCFVGGVLYHTTYLGPRDDQDIKDCILSQIKFKDVTEDDDQ